MSYAHYPAYKDSGVPWLGNIPEHWDWAKLYLLSKRYAGGTPDKNVPEYWENGTIPWLNSGSVNQFDIDTPSAFITEEAYKNSSAKWVPEGALLMALAGQGKTKGMVAQTTFDTTCNQSMAAIVWKKANPRFMLWWLNSQYLNIRGLASSDARDGLNLEMLARIPCPLPSEDEQTAIAGFLDKKTAEIDELIAKKEELLRLLAEQRTALITHAVTKGLNPNAPMKPSGIDWLGDVPEGWSIGPLRRWMRGDTRNGLYKSKEHFSPSGTPFLQMGEAFGRPVFEGPAADRVNASQHEIETWGVITGDLIFARRSLVFEGSGKCSLVGELAEPHVFESSMIRVRMDARQVIPEFAHLYFSGKFSRACILSTTKQVTISGIDSQQLKATTLLVPPMSEQRAIIKHAQELQQTFSSATEKVSKAIEYLKEYRAALITSAVTGKIKVAWP
ncbi:restriction endonuclease subunit S [Phaeobacter inhibens]|uniref:restriction endonuclease subunit S n=1 Tax=Phaeobacter inhibens TaxID=221822 RepID=UPI0021A491CD|nr:restriction endonuclease subunit S [Phaeobacter inhibens]UWR71253.1 restriction endonuclease subunit S [Phaeobacter inhibens]